MALRDDSKNELRGDHQGQEPGKRSKRQRKRKGVGERLQDDDVLLPFCPGTQSPRRCCFRKRFITLSFIAFVAWFAAHSTDNIPSHYERLAPVGVLVEEASRPGLRINHSATVCRRPIVFIPGFVSTALEVWENLPCASSRLSTDFRKRLFGYSMLLTLLEDPECFFLHASLDPDNATDPPGVRLRPDSGFSSVDYIVPGFWVWAKIFRNIADVGYGPEHMFVAAYDWRLSPRELSTKRVGFFDRLKLQVEHHHERARHVLVERGESLTRIDTEGCDRVVFVTHSYGANVLIDFFAWADALSPGWTDVHAHAFVNIGGPLLGIPKASAALLSGEFRDTAMLPRPTRALVDSRIPRLSRAQAFRTWPCLWALRPVGGDTVWPDLLRFRNGSVMGVTTMHRQLLAPIARHSNCSLLERNARSYDPNYLPRMPLAPRLHVLCIYGVSKLAEKGYHYVTATDDDTGEEGERGDADPWQTTRIDAEAPGNGVELTDGDGTVPLHSLAYLCRTQLPFGLPARVGRVTIQEHPDQAAPGDAAQAAGATTPTPSSEEEELLHKILHAFDGIGLPDPRGGAATGDHVDIMGNHLVIETLLKIALGPADADITDTIESDIDNVTRALDQRMAQSN